MCIFFKEFFKTIHIHEKLFVLYKCDNKILFLIIEKGGNSVLGVSSVLVLCDNIKIYEYTFTMLFFCT